MPQTAISRYWRGLPGTELATAPEGTYDFVQAFVKSKAELDRLATIAIKVAKPGALVWITYPKKSGAIKTDITRDSGWDPVFAVGWLGVALVAIDTTWSAFCIRPAGEVKSTHTH